MRGYRTIIFDLDSLLKLLIHYSEGRVPLDTEALEFGVHPMLQRKLGIKVRSSNWTDPPQPNGDLPPLEIRHEGGKVLTWSHKSEAPPIWKSGIESPRRTS